MKKFALNTAFVLILAVSGYSQTEFLEQGASGIHPYAGLKWNTKITQPLVGVEYIIDGRTALGLQMGKPLQDTLLDSAGLESRFDSYFINPYLQFELLEPDNTNRFSVAVRGDFVYETTPSDDSLNGYSRTSFGVGPVFAMPFQAGDRLYIIPQASYELLYTQWKRNWVTFNNGEGLYTDESYFQHDIAAGFSLVYRLTETQGLNFTPKAVFKLGEGRRSSDLLNFDAQLGYFLSF